jgi:hypothetical protein
MSLVASAPFAPKYRESFLPSNTKKHQFNPADTGGLTEAQYNAVLDRIEAIYAPIVAARGGHLVVNRLWNDDTVNSTADEIGQDWIINMYGGLAREKAITQDGEALVACHEIGHLLGGVPKSDEYAWGADEGEADYFANTKCLRRFFADEKTNFFTSPVLAASNDLARAQQACSDSYGDAKERAICVRSMAAGQSVTDLFAEVGGEAPSHLDTPDTSVVSQTNGDHPSSQCRLDTYYQASLCSKSVDVDLSDTDPAAGACVPSQGYAEGMRPSCWYKVPSGAEGVDGAAIAASIESQSRAASSPTLAFLGGSSNVFAGQ